MKSCWNSTINSQKLQVQSFNLGCQKFSAKWGRLRANLVVINAHVGDKAPCIRLGIVNFRRASLVVVVVILHVFPSNYPELTVEANAMTARPPVPHAGNGLPLVCFWIIDLGRIEKFRITLSSCDIDLRSDHRCCEPAPCRGHVCRFRPFVRERVVHYDIAADYTCNANTKEFKTAVNPLVYSTP